MQAESLNPGYQVVRGTRASATLLVLGLAVVALAASLPWWGESSWMREFVEIACYFIFAMMWNLMAGYGGMVSIGQQAFFGLGGYVMLALGNFWGVNPFVGVVLGALVAGLASIACRASPSVCKGATSRSAPGSSPKCSA
jgi:branched-chain amino acid transport system permease protein